MKLLLFEILSIIVLSLLLTTPFGGSVFKGDIGMIDEGQFGAWANHMMHGQKLYSQIYTTYGPLFIYPLYWLFSLFSPSAWLVRVYLIAGSAIGIFAVLWLSYLLKIKWYLRIFLIVTLTLLPILLLRQAIGLFALGCLMKGVKTKKKRWFFVCGFLCVVALLVSLDVGVFTFLTVLFIFIPLLFFSRNILWKQLFIFLLGILLPVAFFIVYTYQGGWLWSYFDVSKDLLTFQGINIPNGQKFPNAFSFFPRELTPISFIKYLLSKELLLYWTGFFYVCVLGIFSIRLIIKKNSDDISLFSLIIFGILLYTILLTRSGIGHYFFVLSPLFIIATYLLQEVLASMKREKGSAKAVLVLFICLYFGFIFRLLLIHRPHIFTALSLLTIREKTIDTWRVGPLRISQNQVKSIRALQLFVQKNTQQNEPVFFLTNEAMMYLLVDRINATRYDLPFIANTLEKRYEVVASLDRVKPQYIFVNGSAWAVDDISNARRLPEVYSYLHQHYRKAKNVGGFIVYERFR